MLKQKETKFVLILIFTLFFPLLIQNSQEESDKTNHNKEYKALLKKAVDMHKLLNELKKERKPDKEKYKELQKTMIRGKLQRWFAPATPPNQSQNNSGKSSLVQESKKRVKRLNVYRINDIQIRVKSGVKQLKTLPYSQPKPILLLRPTSLKNATNNFTLKLPKVSEVKSVYVPPLSLEYEKLVIKKNEILYKLTNLQKEIEEAIEKHIYNYQFFGYQFNREDFSRELRNIMKPLRSFNMKIGLLISEMADTELNYEKMKEFSQRTQDLEYYYKTNIRELMSRIAEKVKKIDNLIFRLKDLEKLISIVAIGEEPYSYLSLKERKVLYQNLCHEYKEIINKLGPDTDKRVEYFFHFYKSFPDFVFKKTQQIERKETLNQEQIASLVSKVKGLTALPVLTREINSIITRLTNIKDIIESNLNQSNINIISEGEVENCKIWQGELEKGQWENLITFDNGKINLKEDFVFLSKKETLNKIIGKIEVCIAPIPPRRIKKLFDDLGVAYKDFFGYITTYVIPLLRDVEQIKATHVYQHVSDRIRDMVRVSIAITGGLGASSPSDDARKEGIRQAMSIFKLAPGQIECIAEDITVTQKTPARNVTADTVRQAFEKCNIQEEGIMGHMMEEQIDVKIGFKKFLSLAKNSDEIIKFFIGLFNSCSQIYLDITEDINEIIKLKYDVFVKTFDYFWDKLKDILLVSKDEYEKNKEDWKTKYICIVRLHQHASTTLDGYVSRLNEDLLIKLCSKEIETISSEEDKQELQTGFEKFLLSKACRMVKIYKKGIKVNTINELDINGRIEFLFDKCSTPPTHPHIRNL